MTIRNELIRPNGRSAHRGLRLAATLLVGAAAVGACMPLPGETVYIRDQDPSGGAVQVVQESYLDDGTDEPIHAVQLDVPPARERQRVTFDLVRESVVTAGALSEDANGGVGLDPNEEMLMEVLPVGSYELVVSAPSGADIVLGAKPVSVTSGDVPVQHAAFVQGWVFRTVMKLVMKRAAQEGLSGICPFTKAMYEQYGNDCPKTFDLPPLCIVGYGITCATPVY